MTDDEIEALAKKHIAPHAERLEAILPNRVPYRQTEQFRRVKALIADVLSKLRAPVADRSLAAQALKSAQSNIAAYRPPGSSDPESPQYDHDAFMWDYYQRAIDSLALASAPAGYDPSRPPSASNYPPSWETGAPCYAADGKTLTYNAPGMPIMVSAADFNALWSSRQASAPVAEGWQPIDTAPAGVRILLGPRDCPVVGVVRITWNPDSMENERSADVVHYNGSRLVADYRCTEWAPLRASAPVAGEAKKAVAWLIDWPEDPELGHYLAESPAETGRCLPLVFADAVTQTSEPVYAYRRKGMDDFVTCDRERFDELSAKPRLFETRIFYAAPQASEAVRDAVLEEAAKVAECTVAGDDSPDNPYRGGTVKQAAARIRALKSQSASLSEPKCPQCALPLRQECNCDEGYAARAALSAQPGAQKEEQS